jgi:exonuclease VII large subunit
MFGVRRAASRCVRTKPTTQGKEVDAMGDQENDRGQPQSLDERLRTQFQDWLSSQGSQIQNLTRQIQEQAGNMWQEFEKRLQSLDDARQALEDRIGRQIDNLLAQQRTFARRLQEAAPSRAKSPAKKAASKRPTARRGTKKASARRPAAKTGAKKSTKRSTSKRPTKRSTAKRS